MLIMFLQFEVTVHSIEIQSQIQIEPGKFDMVKLTFKVSRQDSSCLDPNLILALFCVFLLCSAPAGHDIMTVALQVSCKFVTESWPA